MTYAITRTLRSNYKEKTLSSKYNMAIISSENKVSSFGYPHRRVVLTRTWPEEVSAFLWWTELICSIRKCLDRAVIKRMVT